jgi:hypothetical protein
MTILNRRQIGARPAANDQPPMALTLFKFHDIPDEIAVSKIGLFEKDGATFFLDFSRPIQVVSRRFGFADGIAVPVVHVGQSKGEFVIGVHRSDPYFKDLRKLWKQHYPRNRPAHPAESAGLQIAAAFGTHFPDDC